MDFCFPRPITSSPLFPPNNQDYLAEGGQGVDDSAQCRVFRAARLISCNSGTSRPPMV